MRQVECLCIYIYNKLFDENILQCFHHVGELGCVEFYNLSRQRIADGVQEMD
jgi:hypothetical protein